MIGGRVEENESVLAAAIRECNEGLGNKVILDHKLFRPVIDFDEIATSDPTLKIHFYVFEYMGEINCDFSLSDEIEDFLWYDTFLGEEILSNILKNEVALYCLKNNKIN